MIPVSDGNSIYYFNNGSYERVWKAESLAKEIINTINYYKNAASESQEEANKTHDEVMAEVRDEIRRKDEELTRARLFILQQ